MGENAGITWTNQEQEKVLVNAIEVWGDRSQMMMAIEEMGELLKAFSKLERGRNSQTISDVIEEVADVTIMMMQMAIMFGGTRVQEVIDRKIERLKRRLGEVVA